MKVSVIPKRGEWASREESSDRLHLNAEGYAIWDSVVGPALGALCEVVAGE